MQKHNLLTTENKTLNISNMKAEFIEWEDIRRECKYPQEDNNDGYIYGIAYLDEEGVYTLDEEWFKTDKERYEMAKQEQLEVINLVD